MRRRVKDAFARWRTSLSLNPAPPVLVISILVISILCGLAGVLFTPAVHTRKNAHDLESLFAALLGVVVASTAIYATVSSKRGRLRAYALVAGAIGVFAAVAGLLAIPLDTYRYAVGVAIAGFAYNLLTILVLLV